jgi:hypothetical protein
MPTATVNLNGLLALLGLSPQQRWDAMTHHWPTSSYLPAWVIPMACGVLLVLVAHTVWRRTVHIRRSRAGIGEACARLGLNPQERDALGNLIRLARLRDPLSIFTSASAFDRAAEKLLESKAVKRLPPKVCESTARFLAALREKMKYAKPEQKQGERIADTRALEPRTRLTLETPAGVTLEASLAVSAPHGLEVDLEGDAAVAVNQAVTVRFTDPASAWEFTTTVVAVAGARATLAHSEQIRFVSRREFPRIPIHRPAYVAAFPFTRTAGMSDTPQFVPATVTEIAGPGLRLKAALAPKVGERVVVVVKFSTENRVEGTAIVRRVLHEDAEATVFAVELVALGNADMAELTRETNLAARELKAAPAAMRLDMQTVRD